MFKEIFDAVIDEKHGGFPPDAKHPAPDLDAGKVTSSLTYLHVLTYLLKVTYSYFTPFIASAGLVTLKSNALQLLVTFTKK